YSWAIILSLHDALPILRDWVQGTWIMHTRRWLTAALLAVCGGSATAEDFFADRVAPVLRQRCVSCHNARKSRNGLDLTGRDRLRSEEHTSELQSLALFV